MAGSWGEKSGTVFPENSTGKIFMIQRVVNWDMVLKYILEGIREKTISLDLARAHTHNILRTPVNEQDSQQKQPPCEPIDIIHPIPLHKPSRLRSAVSHHHLWSLVVPTERTSIPSRDT